MQEHFRVSFDPLVELLVRLRRLAKRNLMRDHKAGFCSSSNDQVTQVAVVRLDIALAGAQVQALLEELAEGQQDLTLACPLVWRTWICGHVQAWNAET